MRSGILDLTVMLTYRTGGECGQAWSSRGAYPHITGTATLSDYILYFNSIHVIPSHGPYERSAGYPLRCLSTVLGM